MNSGVAAAISRRKIRGLTRTGRQVSEDPDIDNLLSNLSPEEMEELQKEVLTVPDPDPDTNVLGGIRKRSPPEKQASLNNNVEPCGHETSKLSQRQVSVEGEPRKESLKQQYLRKMGLSQERSLSRSESQDGEVMTQSSVPGEWDREGAGDRPGPPNRFRREENREAERREAGRRTEVNSDSKLRDRKEEAKRKEDGSKTKELISKLREKKEDTKEKERKDEVRKDSKTKELISKLQERGEKEESKEKERKEDSSRRKEDSKTRGLVSRLEEKRSHVKENKTDDRKSRSEDKGKVTTQHDDTGSQQEKDEEKTRKETERNREAVKEKEKGQSNFKGRDNEREKESVKANMKETEKQKDLGEGLKPRKHEEPAAGKIQAGKTKEKEEEEDEDASMFDELLEKVSSNDSQLVELNVNNSEVIKTKTLIHFAEALRDNTHVKTFALANSRADDHVAYAIAGMLRANKTVTSINLDSNHLTSKGIISLIHALQHNATLTELRFHNQRHICGGKTEMEMAKVLKDNTTLLKLGYHFELAGPRMTMTNILSRNMDRQRQRRLQEQKQAQANGDKKGTLEVPKASRGFKTSPKASPKASPLPSPQPSPQLSPKVSPKKGGGGAGPPPPPPPPPPAPALDVNCLRNSLTPVSQRKLGDNVSDRAGGKNSRDQLLASIRNSNIKQLKKVDVPKLLQ